MTFSKNEKVKLLYFKSRTTLSHCIFLQKYTFQSQVSIKAFKCFGCQRLLPTREENRRLWTEKKSKVSLQYKHISNLAPEFCFHIFVLVRTTFSLVSLLLMCSLVELPHIQAASELKIPMTSFTKCNVKLASHKILLVKQWINIVALWLLR